MYVAASSLGFLGIFHKIKFINYYGLADVNEINGVNLDNYVPYESNGDTVLYVHKRVLKEEAEKEAEKAKKKKAKKLFNKNNETTRNDTVLEQTVRFAKHLAPIVIPPNGASDTPIFYTVEACSKCRKKEKPKEVKDDATYEKRKCRKIIETYRNDRKIRKQLHSTTDSITHSSNNTLDDLNINQSLNGTLSEQSEKQEKYVKNEVMKRKRNKEKFIISESLEAIGNELVDTDDTKIKVQLMNDAEKNAFCDSIRSPVLKAVRKCISEFNDIEVKEEIRTVQRVVKYNTDKLDKILDRLANIENLIQGIGQNKSPQKASTLEQLGEDIDDEKSFDEEYDLKKIRHEEDRVENLGCGEIVSMRPTSSVGVKTEKPNRIPARYCWTDSNKD